MKIEIETFSPLDLSKEHIEYTIKALEECLPCRYARDVQEAIRLIRYMALTLDLI